MTLGDSWGTVFTDEIAEGVSLILIQTQKGEDLITGLNAFLTDVDIERAINANTQLQEPARMSPSRSMFLNAVKNEGSFRIATLRAFPQIVIKRWVKRLLFKVNLYRPGGGYRLTVRTKKDDLDI